MSGVGVRCSGLQWCGALRACLCVSKPHQINDVSARGVPQDEAIQRVLFDESGRASLVRSWAASLLRDVPMGAMQIAIFEVLKSVLIQSPDVTFDVNSLQAEAAFGALGGLVGAVLTTPADVVTTRIMTSEESGDAALGPIEVAREIWEQEGAAGFSRGVVSRGAYWAPAIGIFLSLYCSLRQYAVSLIGS